MKLGIDISQIVYKGSGVARFTEGLVNAICEYDDNNEWVFFFSSLRQSLDTHILEKIHQKGHRLVTLPIPPTILSFMWNRLHLINIENFTVELDWFITSDWTEAPSTGKKATIVHDLVFMRYPETLDKTILTTQQNRLNWVQKESNIIFADSQSTEDDLRHYFKIPKEKIVTNYPGVTISSSSHINSGKIKEKFNLKKPFILSVGKIEPRKNIEKLIEAYQELQLQEVDLVIVGAHGWGTLQHSPTDSIHFLGFVSNEDLYSLYKECLFFIFPSIWEGFGYPAVEAMSLGAPTAVSNISSLKEIGEGASYLFNPHDLESIKKALTELTHNDQLRNELKEKGLKKSQQYTWKNYYDTLIKHLYENRD